jgi:HTH-type transcriptional regulator, sugar sensing transcriptional regulator
MKENEYEFLKSLGLTEIEADTYFAILKIGSGSVQQVATRANIPRTTAYGHILKLLELGLIRKGMHRGKNTFIAESPSALVSIQKKKIVDAQKIAHSLQEIFLQQSDDSKATFYAHRQGILTMHEESLVYNREKQTRWLGDIFVILKDFKEDLNDYVDKRIQNGIFNKVIASKEVVDIDPRYTKDANKKMLRKIRYLKGIDVMYAGFFCYDNVVWIVPRQQSQLIVRLESKDIANSFLSLFDFLWGLAVETS